MDGKEAATSEDLIANSAHIDIEAFATGIADFPGFDPEGLRQLVEDTAPEPALKVIARFRHTVAAAQAELEAARAGGDAERVWKMAHKVAGTAELIGFAEFGRASKALSHGVREAPELARHGEALTAYLEKVRALASRLGTFVWLANYD